MSNSNDIHSFSASFAKEHGINAAILYQNICYWIAKNKANKKHFYDGRYWTYNSLKAFEEMYPYMSRSSISRTLKKLEEADLITKGNFNNLPFDRTQWFSLNEHVSIPKMGQEISQNGTTIPDIEPDIEHCNKTKAKEFTPPSLKEVEDYFSKCGYTGADRAFRHYETLNWHNKAGKPVANWKNTMSNNWMKPENKIKGSW